MGRSVFDQWIMSDPMHDPRLDWTPESKSSINVNTREMSRGDVEIVYRLLKDAGQRMSREALLRAVTFHGFTARVAVRNLRNPVGVIVSYHTPDRSTILRYWVHERYEGLKFPERFLFLAALELPEAPTFFSFDRHNTELARRLKEWGWKLDGMDDEQVTYRADPWFTGRAGATRVPDRAAATDGGDRGEQGSPEAGPDLGRPDPGGDAEAPPAA